MARALPLTMYGILVALEADPVPGPVEERLAVAFGLDRSASRGIDRLGADPGPDRPGGGRLGSLQHAVQVAEALIGAVGRVAAGHPERPRDVRPIAADRAADVEDDRLAGRDHPVGCLVVRRGGVGPRADDREVGLVVALGDEPLADLVRDIGLGPAHQPAAGDLGDDPVGGVGRRRQERDLVGVLDDPEPAKHG